MTRDRLRIEACTSAGPAAVVEFHVRPDTVEVTCNQASYGVFDRGALRRWLAEPAQPLEADEVILCVERVIDSAGRVAITLPGADVHQWTLSPSERAAVTALV